MTERHTATLHGYGRLPWPTLAAALRAVPTAWADYHGFHIGACPDQAPPYTHLWAWTDAWLLRARIDGPSAIVGALEIGPAAPTGLTALHAEQVRYVTRTAHTWPAGEKRVGPLPAQVADQQVTLYEVGGPHPITFVRMDGR
ncbi:hypothetical protein GCM10022251_82270 [Phytohabitans flavus]|uniref:Uncharacterized protein n=1 Tax=Phytohabitans flavus TaxID=1076124 RepID=A0A6F8XL89_9ACTN|nr:hypothetical protein [Phytohabitans flavus]BCB74577.1 hypothetical protein Pflav_009870 [Phytohabitans flavus]